MILLTGHYDDCRRYARANSLGRERSDWVHVRDEHQLHGIEGVHRNPDSAHSMIVLYYPPGYYEDEQRFFEMARSRGLLP